VGNGETRTAVDLRVETAAQKVELDKHQFPTYRFVPGVADTSLAHRTAARLGVTREELLALVEASKRVG